MPLLGRVLGAPMVTFSMMIILTGLNAALAVRPTKRELLATGGEDAEQPAPYGFETCFFRSKRNKHYYNYKFEFSVKLARATERDTAATVCGRPVTSAFNLAKGGPSPFEQQVVNGFFQPVPRGEELCDCNRGRRYHGRQTDVKYLTVNLTSSKWKKCSATTCWHTYSDIMYFAARKNKKDWETLLRLDNWTLYTVDHDEKKALAEPPTSAQLLSPKTVTAANDIRTCGCQRHKCKHGKDRFKIDLDDDLPGVDPDVGLMADDDEEDVGVEVVDTKDAGLKTRGDHDFEEQDEDDDDEDAVADTVDLPTAPTVITTIAKVATSTTATATQSTATATPSTATATQSTATKTQSTATTAPEMCLTNRGVQEEIEKAHKEHNVVNSFWTTGRVIVAVGAGCCIGYLMS